MFVDVVGVGRGGVYVRWFYVMCSSASVVAGFVILYFGI